MSAVQPNDLDLDPLVLDPAGAAPLLANLGFIASSDLPDGPGPAYLLVAFRAEPTLRHYDPERDPRLPIRTDFSWGMIRIVDRLRASNEYLTFGGSLAAAPIDGTVVAVFTSPAPILRRGGHSQGWDHAAECVGAFFGRLMVAIDYVPGFEARMAEAEPVVRYAAFVADAVARYRASSALRSEQPDLWALLEVEERRLRTDRPTDWTTGVELLRECQSQGG
jgi:hypothetical protein